MTTTHRPRGFIYIAPRIDAAAAQTVRAAHATLAPIYHASTGARLTLSALVEAAVESALMRPEQWVSEIPAPRPRARAGRDRESRVTLGLLVRAATVERWTVAAARHGCTRAAMVATAASVQLDGIAQAAAGDGDAGRVLVTEWLTGVRPYRAK